MKIDRRWPTTKVKVSGRRQTDLPQALLDQQQESRISALEAGQEEMKNDIKVNHSEIMSILMPIRDTFKTAGLLGKWGMGLAVFISIILGVMLSLIKLLQHK